MQAPGDVGVLQAAAQRVDSQQETIFKMAEEHVHNVSACSLIQSCQFVCLYQLDRDRGKLLLGIAPLLDCDSLADKGSIVEAHLDNVS